MEENVYKRNEMIFLLYSFVSSTSNSHLRLLQRLRERVRKKDVFFYILSKLLFYESDTGALTSDLYSFYFTNATQGMGAGSPVTRTKCVNILSFLAMSDVEPVLPLLPRIEKMCSDEYWELRGQILILCAHCLVQLNEFNLAEEEGGTMLDE